MKLIGSLTGGVKLEVDSETLLLRAFVAAALVAGTDFEAGNELDTKKVAEDEDAAAETKMSSCVPSVQPMPEL